MRSTKTLARTLTMVAVAATLSFQLGAATRTAQPRFQSRSTRPSAQDRTARQQRLQTMGLDERTVAAFVTRFGHRTREQLIEDGYLASPGLPRRGSGLLGHAHRTDRGERLLQQSKDVLFGLLFGDETLGVTFERTERELLTLVVPRAKAHVVEFMKASTELAGAGTWQDPEDVASDERADNVIIEVEYGEVRSEGVGQGIAAALRLINLLEVNEQVIYARMTNVEQSTLVD